MYICVTSGGNVYDRTKGKNVRLVPGTPYRTWFGFVKFNFEDGKVIVERYTNDNVLGYRNVLQAGMYEVSPMSAEPAEKQTTEYKMLLQRLRSLGSRPSFKLIEEEDLTKSYGIKLIVDMSSGTIESKFNIRVKKGNYDLNTIAEIYKLIDRVSKLNLKLIVKNFNLEGQESAIFTIDESFIETAMDIEEYYASTEIAE